VVKFKCDGTIIHEDPLMNALINDHLTRATLDSTYYASTSTTRGTWTDGDTWDATAFRILTDD